MKILMSAYACEPNRGSEPGVGWHWARQAARFHEVWVLTRANNRAVIETELRHRPIPNLHVVYHDLPRWARWWKQGKRGLHLYYLLWQATALPVARRLHGHVQFDLAQHVTFVSLRYPSYLGWLGVPFIWGPIGGGDRPPHHFFQGYGLRGGIQEALRTLSNALVRTDPLVRLTARRAHMILAATPATKMALPQQAHPKTLIVPAIGFDGGLADRSSAPDDPSMLRLIYVGELLHLKGLQLALPAIARAHEIGVQLGLTIIGDGPFRSSLERLSSHLEISHLVEFKGSMPHAEVLRLYNHHDVLLFPSLRDSGGFVVLEAMAAGLPVICLDLGGPSQTVTAETGFRVPAHDPEQVISALAATLVRLADDPELCRDMGRAGQERVRKVYSWNRKGEFLRDLYASLVQGPP